MSMLEVDLKSTVMSEFDAARLKAEQKQKSPPEMAKLWKIIHKQFELIDIKNARKSSLLGASDISKDSKRKFTETISTLSTDHENRSNKQPCSTLSNMAIADSARGATSVIIQPMSSSMSSRLWRRSLLRSRVSAT
jgi:hypothetical protein